MLHAIDESLNSTSETKKKNKKEEVIGENSLLISGSCLDSDRVVISMFILFFIYLIFLKDFIYLFDRERQPVREGTQAGGVGEEEAGPLRRSLMWGSIP